MSADKVSNRVFFNSQKMSFVPYKEENRHQLPNKYFSKLKSMFDKSPKIRELSDKIRRKFRNKNEIKLETTIDYYSIEKIIGKGCFGKVYLAKQVLTQQNVALKFIQKESVKTKESRKKILKEITILQKINQHKNIVQFMEAFEDEKNIYFVFEFIEKGDLVKYFKVHPLFQEEKCKIFFLQILIGIDFVHSRNIIHRDIKLNNILIDRNLDPKICDFGISSIVNKHKRIFDTGGTPAYLAPEVIKSEGQVSYKSDIWSLGVLLYLLTFGKVPFKADNIQVLYSKIIQGKFRIVEDSYCSPELIDLIKRLLVVDVRRRISMEDIFKHEWFANIKYRNIKMLQKE